MGKDINQKILDATLEIIAREKISGTRMHLIAKEANMRQSNLHYYYPTKEDLLINLMENLQKRFFEKRLRSLDLENKSFKENFHGLFEEKKEDILNDKKLDYAQFDFWVQGTVNPEIRARFQKTFNQWRNSIKNVLSKGEFSEDTSSDYMELVPFIIVSLMMGASMQFHMAEDKFNLDEYFCMAEKLVLGFFEEKQRV